MLGQPYTDLDHQRSSLVMRSDQSPLYVLCPVLALNLKTSS